MLAPRCEASDPARSNAYVWFTRLRTSRTGRLLKLKPDWQSRDPVQVNVGPVSQHLLVGPSPSTVFTSSSWSPLEFFRWSLPDHTGDRDRLS